MHEKTLIKVYSEKYNIEGLIEDYGFVTKLIFTYQGRTITMGMNRNFSQSEYEALGQQIIESYIENLTVKETQIRLYNWYIKVYEEGSKTYHIGKGVATGHPRIPDANRMSTSMIKAIFTDLDQGEVILTTMNHIYHCPLEECCWSQQDKYPDLVPDYEIAKEKFQNLEKPSIEVGKVLLVLSDHDEYYFNSLYYKETEDLEPCNYYVSAHVGMFQDSYLIMVEEAGIYLRYFPHFQNIEFYSEDTNDRELYLENIGTAVLFAKTSKGLIKLASGERKQVCEENAEIDNPTLPKGDLYPAGIIE